MRARRYIILLICIVVTGILYPQNIGEKADLVLRVLFNQKSYNKILVYLDKISSIYKDKGELLIYYGDAYLGLDSLDRAESYFRKALIEFQKSKALFNLGETFFFRNDLIKAKKFFDKYLKICANDKATLKFLGQIAIARQDIKQIGYYYREVYFQDSTDVDALLNLGVINLNKGKFDNAEYFLKKAIIYDKNNLLVYLNLGILSASKGDYAMAEKYLKIALRISPKDEKTNYTLGIIFLFENKPGKAETLFNKALCLNPQYNDARAALVILYEANCKLAKAENALEDLSAQQPNYYQLNILKANLFYLRHQYEVAIKYVLKEIEKSHLRPDNYLLLSKLFELTGNKQKAEDAFEYAEKLKNADSRTTLKPDLLSQLVFNINLNKKAN